MGNWNKLDGVLDPFLLDESYRTCTQVMFISLLEIHMQMHYNVTLKNW